MKTVSAIILGAIVMTACAQQKLGCATLPSGGQYCLQATSAIQPFEAQQKVEASINGRHETLITEIDVNSNEMNFVGLTPFGQKVVHVRYDNQMVVAETLPDKRLNPTLILAMLQLSLWPADSVRAGLSKSLTLDESVNKRSIHANKKVIMQVDYVDDSTRYQALKVTLPTVDVKLDIISLPETVPEDEPNIKVAP